jgi:hypothetical protein
MPVPLPEVVILSRSGAEAKNLASSPKMASKSQTRFFVASLLRMTFQNSSDNALPASIVKLTGAIRDLAPNKAVQTRQSGPD